MMIKHRRSNGGGILAGGGRSSSNVATMWFTLVIFFLCNVFTNNISFVKGDGICWMLYQMADNDLEYFIREDNYEFIQSDYVKDPSTTTWIYFDGRNYRDWFFGKNLLDPDITQPLMGLYNKDGTPYLGEGSIEKYQGSRYFTYDHDIGQMIIDTKLEIEQNSDSPIVLYEFLVYALEDCLAKGKTEFFVALSSHGTGVAGFGGDENTIRGLDPAKRKNRNRNLLQTNNLIISALQLALDNVDGAPTQYDMIGFDACLMASFESLDEFASITKYFLASEAVEPGHGWAYDKLTQHDSVLDLGKQIIDTFVDELQGLPEHQTPKQLSLIDTSKWPSFVDAWEALSAEFLTLLESEQEALFRQALQRARVGSLTVEGGWFDDWENQIEGALDIGDFLTNFNELCTPDEALGSNLPTLLANVQTTYDDMFVYRRNGDGTPNLTGMHITWPRKIMSDEAFFYLEVELYNVTHPYYSAHAPFYNEFIDLYLDSNTPHVSPGTACKCDATDDVEIQRDDLTLDDINNPDIEILLLNPRLNDWKEGLEIRSEIASTTDYVTIDYGVEIYHLWKDRLVDSDGDDGDIGGEDDNDQGRRNLLQRRLSNLVKKRSSSEAVTLFSTDQDSKRDTSHHTNKLRPHQDARRAKRMERKYQLEQFRRRQLQGDDGDQVDEDELPWFFQDYFIIFGGDSFVKYSCSGITSTWDRNYFFFTGPDGIEDGAFVEDGGEGARTAYFFYFRELSEEAIASIKEGTWTFDDVNENGGIDASLTFTVDPETGVPTQNLVLFIFDTETGGPRELPPSTSGYIVPLMLVDASIEGYYVDYLVGGYYGTVIEWKEDHGLTVNIDDTKGRFFDELESTLAVLDVTAIDYDKYLEGNGTEGLDFYFFELEGEDLSSADKPEQNPTDAAGLLSMPGWVPFLVAGVWSVLHWI